MVREPEACLLWDTDLFCQGLFEYEEYISLKTINDPNEG